MIFCLTGTSPYCFQRLIEKVDKEIGSYYDVMIQRGYSKYKPVNSKSFDFIVNDQLQVLISKADLIITQGGYGSLMDAISKNKPVIAVPRLEQFNEIVGDQIELVKHFEQKKYVIGCYDLDLLKTLVKKCLNDEFSFQKFKPESNNIIPDIINAYIKKSCK